MRNSKIAIWLTALIAAASLANAESGLGLGDAALIIEARHLRDALGGDLWPDWPGHADPILYKTGERDVLIDHPAPPDGFRRTFDDALGEVVHVRAQEDSSLYGAAFPFGGHWTVVISAPEPADDPCRWALTATHEMFHLYQHRVCPERLIDPFVGPHAGEHELSYPFPYNDEAVRSLFALEAELVYRAIGTDVLGDVTLRRTQRALGHASRLAARVFPDSLDHRFKRWMEWNEGVARYTERELSRLAAASARYAPTEAFRQSFPDADYAGAWNHWEGQLKPVRFVGEGVGGRASFYYLGMGKALFLDRVRPDWRSEYFRSGLDVLISDIGSTAQ